MAGNENIVDLKRYECYQLEEGSKISTL